MPSLDDALIQSKVAEELTRWGYEISHHGFEALCRAGRGPASIGKRGRCRYFRWRDCTGWAQQRMLPKADEWKTRKDICQVLAQHGIKLSPSTLAVYACFGTGPAYRIVRGRAYYEISEVLRWAQQRRKENRPAD